MNTARAENKGLIRQYINEGCVLAGNRYNERFDNIFYTRATKGKSTAYANTLIDEALAICRHPRYQVTHRKWSAWAERFLAEFCIPQVN